MAYAHNLPCTEREFELWIVVGRVFEWIIVVHGHVRARVAPVDDVLHARGRVIVLWFIRICTVVVLWHTRICTVVVVVMWQMRIWTAVVASITSRFDRLDLCQKIFELGIDLVHVGLGQRVTARRGGGGGERRRGSARRLGQRVASSARRGVGGGERRRGRA
jgi:hypothetical protein